MVPVPKKIVTIITTVSFLTRIYLSYYPDEHDVKLAEAPLFGDDKPSALIRTILAF